MTAGRRSVSTNKHWCTPPDIVEAVRRCFGGAIALDPCSNAHSRVGAETEYRLPETDGLTATWCHPTIFVNPPYGRDPERGSRILHWFSRIDDAAERGSAVIALVPVATNTEHWKRYVYPRARSICFLFATRLRFYIDGSEDPRGAPMSCAAIYWGPDDAVFAEEFSSHGAVVSLAGVQVPGCR